jgi:hypothetical protein
MNKIILLIIFLASELYGYSQLTPGQPRDSSWYVVLKDSTVLYSKRLWVRYSEKDGDYLLLDYNKKIPMSEVARYKNRSGDYIRMKGPVETYRIEMGGPRLFVYSREFTYSDTSGFHTGHDAFIRKGPDGDMQEMNFKNLNDAMADNAASMRQLQASRSTLVTGGVIGAAGFLLTVIGAVQWLNQNRDGFTLPPPPSLRDLQAGRLPTQTAQAPKKRVPALAIAGPVIMIGAMVYLFTAPGHIKKAINIYNQ